MFRIMIVVLIDSQVLDILAVQHKSKYCGVKKSVLILCVTCRKVESKKQGWGVMIRLLMPFFPRCYISIAAEKGGFWIRVWKVAC